MIATEFECHVITEDDEIVYSVFSSETSARIYGREQVKNGAKDFYVKEIQA